MSFSKIADTFFSWIIKGFENATVDNLKEVSHSSPTFTTSVEPNRQWHLVFSIKRYSNNNCNYCCRSISSEKIKNISIKLICAKNPPNPEDLKVNISIENDSAKTTKSFLIFGDINEVSFDNFIDVESFLKMIQGGKIKLFVKVFLKKEENETLTNLEFLSDFQICIQGQVFEAHKVILARKSTYFYNMFKEDKEIKVFKNLENIKPEIFKIILKHIYAEEPFNCFDSDTEKDVLLAASFLGIEDFKDTCENNFRKKISTSNVCSIFSLSLKASAKFLQKHCLSFILRNLPEINFKCLKTEPKSVLCILKDIFEQLEIGCLTVVDSINLSLKNDAVSASYPSPIYESFLNNKHLSDVEIHVGEETIYCHKVILSANSPVFCNMLISKMEEDLTNVIKIKDIEPEVFYELIRYSYTGKVENLDEYGVEILIAADRYDLKNLQNLTEEFLATNLTNENVVIVAKIADTCNASFLFKHCTQYIMKHMISSPKMRKMKNVITLDMFNNFRHNIFYEFLQVLKGCEIKFH